jgi:hypothetical protein
LDETLDTAIWVAWFVGLVVIVGAALFVAHRELTGAARVSKREDSDPAD